MGHPRHRLHRRLRSSRLVHGLGAEGRVCAVCDVSDCDRDCRAGLGSGDDRTLISYAVEREPKNLPRCTCRVEVRVEVSCERVAAQNHRSSSRHRPVSPVTIMAKMVSKTMMRSTRRCAAKTMLLFFSTLIPTTVIPAGAIALGFVNNALAAASDFGTANPFYAPSTLPFQAPPFHKIRDEDFQPAIEAGMAQAKAELLRIADNPDAPTFDNTIVAMEKSGRLFDRAMAAFDGVTGANTNPTLQNVKTIEAPKLAAHRDFLYLNTKLFTRVSAIYKQRNALKLDPESLRLLEHTSDQFVHAGANLSEADQPELRKLNEEI